MSKLFRVAVSMYYLPRTMRCTYFGWKKWWNNGPQPLTKLSNSCSCVCVCKSVRFLFLLVTGGEKYALQATNSVIFRFFFSRLFSQLFVLQEATGRHLTIQDATKTGGAVQHNIRRAHTQSHCSLWHPNPLALKTKWSNCWPLRLYKLTKEIQNRDKNHKIFPFHF